MLVTVYRRSFPVEGAPVSVSFLPFDGRARYTFVAGDAVHDPVCEEVGIVAPAGARVNRIAKLLSCAGGQRRIRMTATQVYEMALMGCMGFRLANEAARIPPCGPSSAGRCW